MERDQRLRALLAALMAGQTFGQLQQLQCFSGNKPFAEATFYRDLSVLSAAINAVTTAAVHKKRRKYIGGAVPLNAKTDTTWAHRVESSESTTEIEDEHGDIIDFQHLLNRTGKKGAPKATTLQPVRSFRTLVVFSTFLTLFSYFTCCVYFGCRMITPSRTTSDRARAPKEQRPRSL